MNEKKVLILVNHDLVIYNFRKELVEELIRKNYQVYISSPYGEKIDKLVDMGSIFFDTKVNRHGLNVIEDTKLIYQYKKIMKDIKPDVVLTYTIKPNIYGGIAAKSLKIPYIANITGLGTALENQGILQVITKKLYKHAFSKVYAVYLQNEENYNFFINNKISAKKCKIIPGSGVNLKEFQYLIYPDEKTIEFAFISRIMKEKGMDVYLHAAEKIKLQYKNTRFHICGFCEQDYTNTIRAYAEKDIVIYHGMVNDIRKILKNVHCIIHPSYYPEGMSNILLESSASGRPIITTNRSGCKETVQNGKTGYIIKIKDESDLIEKIRIFLHLSHAEKKQMGEQGRKYMENKFDRTIIINEYMKSIKEAINQYDK